MSPVRGLRWRILALVAIVTAINYIDRNALALMWVAIGPELGLDKTAYAAVVMGFMVAYGVGHTLTGRMFDRTGTRLGFVIAVVVWSVGIGAHALVGGAVGLGAARIVLGIGEAGNWPGAAKSNAEWFPPRQRALAQGIFNAGAAVGAVVSAPLVALLFGHVGWRLTFAALSVLALLWLIPWLWTNRGTPETHPRISEQERKLILENREDEKSTEKPAALGWRETLRFRESWAILFARFFYDPIWWIFLVWLPLYLAERFGFDVKQIGAFAWVPYAGGALGSVAGGDFSGRLIKRGTPVLRARKVAIGIGSAMMAVAMPVAATAFSPTVAVLAIAFVLFGFLFAMGNIQTLPADCVPIGAVGTLVGMGGTASTIGVLITTAIVPFITQTSQTPMFILAGALIPLGFCTTLWLLRHR